MHGRVAGLVRARRWQQIRSARPAGLVLGAPAWRPSSATKNAPSWASRERLGRRASWALGDLGVSERRLLPRRRRWRAWWAWATRARAALRKAQGVPRSLAFGGLRR